MTSVQVTFPVDVFAALRKSPDEIAREVRLAAAIRWYAQGLVSQGKGAELAGLSRADFIDELAAADVAVSQVSLDELEAEARRR